MTFNLAAFAAVLLFAGGMTYAGLKDIGTMTIPNRLVLLLLGAFLVLAPLAGLGGHAMVAAAFAFAAALACGFALFACGWIGGGDAKLAAVAVLWLGPSLALDFALYASIAGALFTLAILQYRKLPLPAFLGRMEWSARMHDRRTGIPYGAALAAAALILLPESPWLAGLL